jgi:hypothetical protein
VTTGLVELARVPLALVLACGDGFRARPMGLVVVGVALGHGE